MIRAGRLRHRITILRRKQGVDGAGQPMGAWEKVAGGIPAEVLFLSGKESPRGDRVEATATHRVTMRHRFGVKTTDRVQWGESTFEIVSLGDPEGRGREWVLRCVEAT